MAGKSIEHLQGLSIKIDELYEVGKKEEGQKLLSQATKNAMEIDEAYHFFFLGEMAGYLEDNQEERLSLYKKALSLRSKDPFLLRQKGVSLSKLGRREEAITYLDKALAINPVDYKSLSQKGVSLSKLERLEEAITYFDKALAINPVDYNSLRQKGVSLSKLERWEEAISYFEKALAINPVDYDSLRQKGVSLSKLERWEEAISYFEKALAIKPNDHYTMRDWAIIAYKMKNPITAQDKIREAVKLSRQEHEDNFRLIMRLTGKNPDKEWKALFPDDIDLHGEKVDKLTDIRGFVGTIRNRLAKNCDKFLALKEAAETKEKMFLLPESHLAKNISILLTLRKWNSYTPAIPPEEGERCLGGGYFIYHNGKGIVIDPGYNFIENFHDAGCRIHDIDAILISHAHNDHTIDFESICTLLYQYNRDAPKNGRPIKKFDLYLNNSAFKKFSGLLNLMDSNFEIVRTLNVENEYQITEGVHLSVLPAFHDDVVSRNQSVGFLLTFSLDEKLKKILFTCDTGLFPLCKDGDELKPDMNGEELWKMYPISTMENLDLMVIHIGSIKREELHVDLNLGIEKCLYANHLGIIGVARMITKLKPSLAIISEFGEEMRQFRRDIVKQIEKKVVNKAIKVKRFPRLAPGDLAFIYDIAQGKFLCCSSNKWIDVSKIDFDYDDDEKKEDICYFDKDILKSIRGSAYAGKIKGFKKRRQNKEGMYFQL